MKFVKFEDLEIGEVAIANGYKIIKTEALYKQYGPEYDPNKGLVAELHCVANAVIIDSGKYIVVEHDLMVERVEENEKSWDKLEQDLYNYIDNQLMLLDGEDGNNRQGLIRLYKDILNLKLRLASYENTSLYRILNTIEWDLFVIGDKQ